MGTPDWLVYPQHPPAGASVAVSDIEQMSRDENPRLRLSDQHAPLTGLIGAGGRLYGSTNGGWSVRFNSGTALASKASRNRH
jgi:hypothetical protein